MVDPAPSIELRVVVAAALGAFAAAGVSLLFAGRRRPATGVAFAAMATAAAALVVAVGWGHRACLERDAAAAAAERARHALDMYDAGWRPAGLGRRGF